jgi:hypothetical protein
MDQGAGDGESPKPNGIRFLASATEIMQDRYTDRPRIVATNMRSEQLDLSAYDSDKIKHGYLGLYDPVLTPWIDKEITLLEVGVHRGGSLRLWRDYFPRGTIIGIDRRLPEHFQPDERIQIFEGSQGDKAFLSKVANSTAPDGFDIIIDDASHIGEKTKGTFWHLFDHHLKPGGLYAIEDWGTGYLDDFPDGRKFQPKPSIGTRIRSSLPRRLRNKMKAPFPCHSYGMVGFVKELVDEQGARDVAMGCKTGQRRSKFQNVLITSGVVFVTKATSSSMRTSSNPQLRRATLAASPNPVPAGDGVGKTVISWSTGDENSGKVWVSVNGGKESLFAIAQRGVASADWIQTGPTYEFRLYDSNHTRLLGKIVVTRATE